MVASYEEEITQFLLHMVASFEEEITLFLLHNSSVVNHLTCHPKGSKGEMVG